MALIRSQVLVVGAGPAGCAAGIMLARAGLDVCVVDRARFPRPKACGDAVSNRAVRVVETLLGSRSALDALPHASVHGAAVVFPDGEQVTRSYNDPGRIIPRERLDAALWQALDAAGAHLVDGVAVRELERDETGGSIVGALADGRRWRADAVIAADGPGSVGLRAIGAAPPRSRRLGVAATAYLTSGGSPVGVNLRHLDPELPCGYGWLFPAVEGLANVGVYQRFDHSRRQGVPLRRRFDRFLGRQGLDRGAIVGGVRVWALPLCASAVPPAAPGLLLCGDAAGLVDPLSGEGIWQALHSGTLAARIAIAALATSEGLSLRWAHRYQRLCAREIGVPSMLRWGVQAMVDQVVRRRLYTVPVVRGMLGWGYRRGSLEISKRP